MDGKIKLLVWALLRSYLYHRWSSQQNQLSGWAIQSERDQVDLLRLEEVIDNWIELSVLYPIVATGAEEGRRGTCFWSKECAGGEKEVEGWLVFIVCWEGIAGETRRRVKRWAVSLLLTHWTHSQSNCRKGQFALWLSLYTLVGTVYSEREQ